MTPLNKRFSTSSEHDPIKEFETKKDMWSTMLDSVASGKRLPEKNIIMLGGTPESQKDFIDNLSTDQSKTIPIHQTGQKLTTINNFALGYTYHDVLDADQEDTLARLSIFQLSDPSPSFTSLLKPLLTQKTIPNTLGVILLDWAKPWLWLRQLQAWIRLLRTLLSSLNADCKEKMEETMNFWREKGRSVRNIDGLSSSTTSENDFNLPLGSGEWDEALGIPLSVVCQNSDQIEILEKEQGWKEEEFDFVLQFLRTVLLKHGASLIYTSTSLSSSLQSLIHSSLGIHSLIKRQPLKHNVIDKDKVLVPPNWDSWGKIRVLRDGFKVEDVSKGWSLDIEENVSSITTLPQDDRASEKLESPQKLMGAVDQYENFIRVPSIDTLEAAAAESNGQDLEVFCEDTQEFLATQLEVLKTCKLEEKSEKENNPQTLDHPLPNSAINVDEEGVEEPLLNDHIGPFQFNMGGIHVDADDISYKYKDHQSLPSSEPTTPGATTLSSQTDALASFFEGLMHRGGVSASTTPKSKPI